MKKFSPLISFIAILGLVAFGTYKIADKQKRDLENKQIPDFELPLLSNQNEFINSKTLLNQEYFLINFFASWCTSCRIEHELLLDLSKNLKIIGIAWRDIDIKTKKFLEEAGNPYYQVLTDSKNDFGKKVNLSGTPESFLVDKNGNIVFYKEGPLQQADFYKIINILNDSNS